MAGRIGIGRRRCSDGVAVGEITIHLDEVLADREMTLTELSDRVGLTLANLSILKTGKARAVRFSTLIAICDVLDCQPGDLLKMRP